MKYIAVSDVEFKDAAVSVVAKVNNAPAGTAAILTGREMKALRDGRVMLMEAPARVGRPKK